MKAFQCLSFIVVLCCGVAQAVPVGTQFTYQGELMQSGFSADGVFDFEFQLFDATAGGGAVSPTVLMNGITVSRGLFTTLLDFGDGPFAGDAVFLEIRVKQAGSAGFTTLAPRQALTPTPYAIQSEFVGINGVDSGSIVDSTITAADIASDAVGTSEIVNNSVTSADIAANAVGTSEIINSQVQQRVSGICPAGEAVSRVNQDGSVNCQAAGADTDWNETASSVWTDRNVAIGDSDATIGSGTFVVHGPFDDSFGGMFVNVNGTGSEQPFYGYATNNGFRAWTEFNESTDQWRVNINNGYRFYVTSSGQVGVNENDPQATLHVDGSVRFEDLGVAGTGTAPLRIEPDGDVVAGPNTFTIAIHSSAFDVEETADEFVRVLGSGHAYIQSGFGGLSAPVNLPDGATVTGVNIWYIDDSTSDMTFRLRRASHTSNVVQDLAAIIPTSAIAGIRTGSDTTISLNPVTNATHSYHFRVFSSNWTGSDMGIRAVTITYRL